MRGTLGAGANNGATPQPETRPKPTRAVPPCRKRRRPSLTTGSRAMAVPSLETAPSAVEADSPHLHVARDEWTHHSTPDGHQPVTSLTGGKYSQLAINPASTCSHSDDEVWSESSRARRHRRRRWSHIPPYPADRAVSITAPRPSGPGAFMAGSYDAPVTLPNLA